MKSKLSQRLLAGMLSVAMMLNMGITPIFAATEGALPIGTSSVCTHHVHDEKCGYIEGTPCTHEHKVNGTAGDKENPLGDTEDCYTEVTKCVHEHTAECYSGELICGLTEEVVGSGSSSDATHTHTQDCYKLNCTHICDEKSGCITKELACKHVHDDKCGYKEGTPCTFDPATCEICNPKDSGIVAKTITAFAPLAQSEYTLPIGADEATIANVLVFPKTIKATANKAEIELAVTWESDKAISTEKADTFTYTAKLTDEGYPLAKGVSLPTITVAVEEVMAVQTYATASQSPTWEIRNAAHDKRTVIYGNGFPLKLEGYTPKGSSITYTRILYGTQNTTDFDSCTTDMNLDGLGVTACENAGKRYYNLSEVTIYGGTGTLDEIKEAGKPGKPKIDEGGSIYMIGGEVASLVGGSRVNGSKNTEIRMTGGTVTGNIYGGNMGYLYDMGDFTNKYFTTERYDEKILYEFRANVTGRMNITISGGTVGGSVYAGGYNYACTGTGTVKVLSSADVDGAKVVVGPELLANSPLYYQDKLGRSQNDTSRSLKFFVDRVGLDTTTREEDTHATNFVKHECSNALYRTTDGYTVHGTVSADDIAENNAVIIAKGTNLKFDANAQLNANGRTIVNHGIVNMLRGGAISGGSFRSDGKVLPPVTVDNIVDIPEQPYLSKGAKPTITLTGAKVVIDGKTFEMAAENNFKTTYKYNDNLGINYYADAIITSIDDPTFSLTKQFYIVQGYSTIGDVKFLRADGTQVSTISDSFYVSFNVLSIDDDVVADKTPDLNNLTKTGTYPLGESSLTIRDRKTQKVIFTTNTVYEDKKTPDYYVFKVPGTDTTTLSDLKVAAGVNDVTISVGEINYFHPAEKTVQKDGFPLCYYMPVKDSWALTSYGYPMVISAGTKDASKLVFSNEDGTCVYEDANGNIELTINPKTAIGSATTKYIPENSYVTVKSGKIALVTGGVADVSHIYGNAVLQNAHLTIEGGTIENAFGAAVSLISQLNGSPVTQNAHVTMTGGHVTNLYGGGRHNAVTTGNTYVLMTGGTAEHVYGGGDRKNTVYGDRNGVVLMDGAAEVDSFDNLLYRVGNQYVVKGSLTLWEDLTIPAGITLIVPQGASLTIPNGVGFTVENGGFIGLGAHIVVQPGASVALAGSIAVLESNVVAYTGSPVTAKTVVAIGDCTFTAGADYTVTYRNNTNKGTATAVLTGKAGGRLTGSVELPFTISASMGTVTVDAGYARSYINNSKPIPEPTNAQITRNSTGKVSISWYAGSLTAAQIAISTPLSGAPSAVGEYTLVCKVAADGTYSEATVLTKITVSYAEAEAVATISGTMKRPESGWYTSDVILTAPAGYTISSDGNAAADAWAGTVTIATDMNGDYTYYLKNSSGLVGTAQKILVRRDTVCDVKSFVYASSDAMDATLVSSDGINLSISTQLKVAEMGNEESFDVYTIIAPWDAVPTEADILLGAHQHVTALGSYPVTISGKYYGIKSLRASVLLIDAAGNSMIPNSAEIDKNLSEKPVGIDFSSDDLTVTVDGEEPIYDGLSHSLNFSVRYKGVLLPKIAYELTYQTGRIEPASYPVTVKPKGTTYSTNEKAGTFTIHPITLTEDSLIWNNFDLNQQYTGKAMEPANYLTTQPVRYEVIKDTAEFSVAYKNNTEPGTAEVIVTGIKHYTGSAIKRFNIVKKNTSYETISGGKASIAYTGKPISIDISRIAANPQNFTLDEMVVTYYASFDDMNAKQPMAQGPIDVGTYYVTIGFPGDRYRAAATTDGSGYVTLTVYAENNTKFTLPDLMVYERAADLPSTTTKERNIQGLLDTYKLGLRYDTTNSVAASVIKVDADAESSFDLVKSSSNNAAMSETFTNVKSGNIFKAKLGTNVSGGGYESVWFHYIVKVVTELPKTDFSDRVSLTTTTKTYTGAALDFSGVTVTNPPEGYDENKWEYSYGSATIASDKNDRPKEIGEYLVSAHYTDETLGLTASIITPVKVEVPAAIDAKSASAPYGGSVTLTAQLHKQDTPWQEITGGTESTDRIYFYHNGILLGNPLISYSDGANQVNGVASITLAIDSKRLLASGANTVTAVFAGGAKLSACQQDFTVTVEQISLSNDMVIPVGSYIYHPAGLTPTLNVTDNLGIQPSDWKIGSCTYGTGKDIGKATVTIVPTEGSYYSGTASATFAVSPKAVSAAVPNGVAIAPAADVAYTGSVAKPVLSITDTYTGGVKTLVEGTDYTISTTAVEIGAATADVTFKGNYSGNMTADFAIKAPSELGTLTVKNGTTETSAFAFGDTITVSFTPKQKVAAFGLTAPSVNQAALYLGDTQLTAPVVANKEGCFTLSYNTADKGIPMGSQTLTIKYGGSGTLSASTKDFGITLTAKDIRPTIAAIAPVNYNGKAHTPAITVTYNGQPITAADYDVTYSDNINAGTATALVTLKGNYTGTRSQSFTINALTITPTVTVSTEGTTYTGRQITPAVTVKNDNAALIQGQDYTVAYGKNIDVGNGTVTVTLKGNYTGRKTETFAITKSGSTVTPEASTKATYGDKITLKATVAAAEVATFTLAPNQVEFFCGETSLGTAQVTDGVATLEYDTAGGKLQIGDNTITATFGGNDNLLLNDSKTNTAKITVAPATPTFTWSNATQTATYTGSEAVITAPTVTGVTGGTTPNGTISYTYEKNSFFSLFTAPENGLPVNAGTYTVTAHIAAEGNYTAADSATMKLTINKSTPSLTINTMNGKTYDGTAVTNPTEANMTITGANYADVKFAYSKNGNMGSPLATAPKDAGTYYVQASVVAGDNTTAASSTAVNFTIAQAALTVTGGTVTQREYNGDTGATVTALTFSGLVNGETLAITTDYTVGSPAYNDANAGTDKTVTGTAALASNDKTANYTLTGKYTISGQTISKATGLAAPTFSAMDDKANTFTFTPVSGYTDATAYEYSMDGGTTWTDVTTNPISVGNVAGTIKIRIKETANYETGAVYTHSAVFTATLEGTVAITGTATYGETLTATVTGQQTGAELSYKWLAGTAVLQSGASNTLKVPGSAVGNTITVEVTATGYNGNLTSSATNAVAMRAITVTAAAQSKTYGQTDPTLTYTVSAGGLINNDTLTGALTRAAGEAPNTYAIAQGTLDNAFYNITYVGANLTIGKASVTLNVTVDPAAAKVERTVTIKVDAKNAADTLMTSGWSQPSDVTLTGPGNAALNLTPVAGKSGKYTASYTVPAGTAVGTQLTFTAAVADGTGNYTIPANVTGTLTVTDKSAVKLTLQADKTTGVTYGDSVTYTAKVEKDSPIIDVLDTLDGTVSFYLGEVNPENLLATKTIGSDTLAVTLDSTKLTAGSHTVSAVYSGNGDFATATQSTSTTVAQKALTWDVSGLSALKKADGTKTATITGNLLLGGAIKDIDPGFSYTGISGEYDSAEAGERTVTVTVSGAAITNANYALPVGNPSFTGTINPVNTLPAPPESGSGTNYKLEQEVGISIVPDALKSNPNLDTPAKIEARMKLSMQSAMSGVDTANIEIYDMTLWFNTDGITWTEATEANFPAGGITIVLPYPAGTGKDSFNFTITHMFTTGAKAGTTETITPTKTASGLEFKLHSLSPIAVGYKAVSTDNGGGNGGDNGGSSSATYYTITATAGAGGSISTGKSVSVREGDSAGFTMTPEKGYIIADVKVNGKSVGAVKNYVFTNVRSNQTIEVTFKVSGGHVNPQTGVA